MEITTAVYIMLTLVVLIIVLLLEIFTLKKKKLKRSSRLATSAMMLIVLGIVFGDNRLIGYGLIGAGVLLSVLDIVKTLEKKKRYGK